MSAVGDTQTLFLTACSRWLASVQSCAASDAFKAAHPKNAGLEAIVDAPTVYALEILEKKAEEMHAVTSKMDSDSLLGLRAGHTLFVDEAKTHVVAQQPFRAVVCGPEGVPGRDGAQPSVQSGP